MQKNKENKGIIIKIITGILVVLCIIYAIIIIKNQNYRLIPGVIGIGAIIVTLNIANHLKIKKEKSKLYSIASLILSLVSIPLLFVQVVFSYILTIPAFIISKKALRVNNTATSKICFGISLLMLIACIVFSLMGGFSYVTGPTLIQ